ncbi:MAG TPA: S9 family peptidase [Anaerolineales bacterium]|nr:S9 family peptidase [Anaerolineales bacterium]
MAARKLRKISAEDLYKFQLISSARISPDGAFAIYAVQRVDQKSEKKFSNLWRAGLINGQQRQFTLGDQNDSAPCWSPDGDQIAFLSNRKDAEKPAQIYLIPADGGEARQLCEIDGTISNLSWSPDGKKLLCAVLKKDAEEVERQKDEQKKKLGVVARHYQRIFYKLDGFGYLPHERWHIWVVDVRNGKAKQLTDHPVYDEQYPAWSPDGKWIAFISNRSQDPDSTPDHEDIYLLPASGGEIRRLDAPTGGKSLPSFSPDGKWLAYLASEGENQWYKNTGLWVVPLDGSSPTRNLTAKYDLHVSSQTINDMGNPEMMPPTWSKDSESLYFQVVEHGSTLLKSIQRNGEGLQTILGEEGVVGSYSLDQSQGIMLYFWGSMNDPCQLFSLDMASKQSKQVTRLNPDLINKLDLGQMETLWIQGPDGNKLQGWVLKPPGFDPNQKYPSILEIHGGPITQYGFFFMHEFYYLAAQGYVVHFCNPRGGRGYGEEHARAIWGDWGNRDYADIMAWTDHIASLPYIDTGRLGVTGGSYGGYMTVWIIGHTQRFKAAVTQRCVSNFLSMWGSSDMNWVFQHTLEAGAPFEDFEKIWDRSPIKYIGNAQTPTLVIHSENDLRCPIEQGEQVFVSLKRLGVDTEMVRFPGEFHGLSRTGRTDRRIVRLNHIARWFNQYL